MLKLFFKLAMFLLLILSSTILYQKHTYAYHTLIHLDPLPHTKLLMKEKRYVDADQYLSYFMQFDSMQYNSEAKVLLEEIKTIRESFTYQTNKFVEGISTGISDEAIGQVSAIGSDFFLIGDLRDLALEGTHYYKDEEVDMVLVSLSTIGLVASASTIVSLGGSAVAKSGISVLKLAHKSKAIPTWLATYLIKQAKQIRHTKNVENIKPLLSDLDLMQKNSGLTNTLKLLSQTQSLKELKKTAKLTKRYGHETPILLKLSNKQIINQAKTLKRFNIQTIKLASTYGSTGLIHLIKGGEKNFIKSTKRLKAYTKVGYKGEVWKWFIWLMKNVSDIVLGIIMGIATLALLPFRKLKIFYPLASRSK